MTTKEIHFLRYLMATFLDNSEKKEKKKRNCQIFCPKIFVPYSSNYQILCQKFSVRGSNVRNFTVSESFGTQCSSDTDNVIPSQQRKNLKEYIIGAGKTAFH